MIPQENRAGNSGTGEGVLSNQSALASERFGLRTTKAAELLVHKRLSTQAEANALGAGLLSGPRKALTPRGSELFPIGVPGVVATPCFKHCPVVSLLNCTYGNLSLIRHRLGGAHEAQRWWGRNQAPAAGLHPYCGLKSCNRALDPG